MTKIITIYTYDELVADLTFMARQIKGRSWTPTMILGVSRGGLVPATMLSHFFNIPLYPYHISLRDNKRIAPLNIDLIKNQELLVVDDICDIGNVLATICNKLGTIPTNTKYLTLHYKPANIQFMPDYYANIMGSNGWIRYPWESWWKND